MVNRANVVAPYVFYPFKISIFSKIRLLFCYSFKAFRKIYIIFNSIMLTHPIMIPELSHNIIRTEVLCTSWKNFPLGMLRLIFKSMKKIFVHSVPNLKVLFRFLLI